MCHCNSPIEMKKIWVFLPVHSASAWMPRLQLRASAAARGRKKKKSTLLKSRREQVWQRQDRLTGSGIYGRSLKILDWNIFWTFLQGKFSSGTLQISSYSIPSTCQLPSSHWIRSSRTSEWWDQSLEAQCTQVDEQRWWATTATQATRRVLVIGCCRRARSKAK